MASSKHKLAHRTWTKDTYLISTDPALVPIPDLNAAFASDTVYWAEPLPEDVWREALDNSLCFGLYQAPQTNSTSDITTTLTLIGFARCITDFATFMYLTDVYIDPACQGNGLGAWLVGCIQEVIEEMPHLRRSLLFTGDWKRSVPFYEKLMGMSVMECRKGVDGSGEGVAIMQWKGPAFPEGLR